MSSTSQDGKASAAVAAGDSKDGEPGPANLRVQQVQENDNVKSPTTSVKALLADTNAAPPPAKTFSSSIPSSSSSSRPTFEEQQSSLRKRQTGASSVGDEGIDGSSHKPAEKTTPPPAIDGSKKPGKSTSDGRPTFQQTLQDLRDFLFHFLKVLPFKGLQNYIKKAIGPLVRFIVRGVAQVLHRGQYGLASNLAFDVHLLLWKVRSALLCCLSFVAIF